MIRFNLPRTSDGFSRGSMISTHLSPWLIPWARFLTGVLRCGLPVNSALTGGYTLGRIRGLSIMHGGVCRTSDSVSFPLETEPWSGLLADGGTVGNGLFWSEIIRLLILFFFNDRRLLSGTMVVKSPSNTAGFLVETPCSELFIKSVNSYKHCCCYFIELFESLEVIDIYINSTIISLS